MVRLLGKCNQITITGGNIHDDNFNDIRDSFAKSVVSPLNSLCCTAWFPGAPSFSFPPFVASEWFSCQVQPTNKGLKERGNAGHV